MSKSVLIEKVEGELVTDYVRRLIDHAVVSEMGPENGLIAAYRELPEVARLAFTHELMNRYVSALGEREIARRSVAAAEACKSCGHSFVQHFTDPDNTGAGMACQVEGCVCENMVWP